MLPLALSRSTMLRYGENPHQQAALYVPQTGARGIAAARQVQGKELSYNNLNDADGALELIAEFRDGPPACAIVKHANPCGVATAATPAQAYADAFDCDRTSAFGGIVALNRPLDGPTAEAIAAIFTEVVIAPDADDAARAVFAAKKNLRLLLTGELPDPRRPGLALRQIGGGMLVQSRDNGGIARADCTVVTKRAPTEAEWADMLFAWTVAKPRQVERHRLCQGRQHRRHRRGADEPARFVAHRRDEGARCRHRGGLARTAHHRLARWRRTPSSPSPTE